MVEIIKTLNETEIIRVIVYLGFFTAIAWIIGLTISSIFNSKEEIEIED